MAPKEKSFKSAVVDSLENDKTFEEGDEEFEKLVAPQASPWEYEWVLSHVIFAVYLHLAAFYGLYFVFYAKWSTLLFMPLYWAAGVIGVTAGTHRLWSHRAYKATLPLQVLLMLCYSCNLKYSISWWVNIHRRHHKFSDTDADPHNSTRGFWFSHIIWLLARRHPECVKRKKCVDVSDVSNNPVIKFQERNVNLVTTMMTFIFPMSVLLYCGESWNIAWHVNLLRIAILWNCGFAINSVAHSFGTRPYDKHIVPTQNSMLSIIAFGEGFHNYHHTFPWDYKTAELGNNWLNLTTIFINFMAKIGWAYDLKTVSPEMIARRAERTGDGSSSWGF